MRDFNDILVMEDKRGNVPHPNWLLNGFRQAISDCDLIDVAMQGHAYTWARKLGHEDVVEERLDRTLVNQSWMNLFPHCTLQNLVSGECEENQNALVNVQKIDVKLSDSVRVKQGKTNGGCGDEVIGVEVGG
jgi:hypothetical protein